MKKARACFADGGQISKADQLIAEMERKYGVSGNSQPAPPPVQQPAPQPAPPQQPRGLIGDAINIFSNRTKQIDKAAGYANGGKIVGPGTPTSDSIPAEVEDTGEPIRVANKERIVSHDQDQFLESIAAKMGFKNLDAMLEAGTGKPVGPTIKGGKKAAAGGWSLDNNPDEYAKAMQEQVLGRDALAASPSFSVGAGQAPTIYDNGGLPTPTDRVSGSLPVAKQPAASPLVDGIRPWYAGTSTADSRTGLEMERDRRAAAASAGVLADPVKSALLFGFFGGDKAASATGSADSVSTQPAYSNEGRGVPSAVTKPGAGAVVDNEFTQGGKSYTANPTGQQGILRVTAPGTSPLYTNIDPAQGVAGLKNQSIGQPADQEAQGLARIANANKIRGEMIANRDKAEGIPAGGWAPGILGDGGIEAANAEKTQRWRNDELLAKATRGNQAAIGAIVNSDSHRDVATMGNETQRQNAGLAAQVANNRDNVTMRGQDLQAQSEAARIAGNPVDSQMKQLSLVQAQKMQQLYDKAAGGDAGAIKELQLRNTKEPNYSNRYTALPNIKRYNDMGQVIGEEPGGMFDNMTGTAVGNQQQTGSQQATAPKAGEVRGGYRFKGGNPADKASWEKA